MRGEMDCSWAFETGNEGWGEPPKNARNAEAELVLFVFSVLCCGQFFARKTMAWMIVAGIPDGRKKAPVKYAKGSEGF